MDRSLPRFIPPMLAVMGQSFDSDDFFFEFKWDGFRTSAYVEGGGYRLMSRKGLEVTEKYPSLSRLGSLPEGLVLDGELVAFVDGRPSFEGMQGGARSRKAAIVFIAFDLLCLDFAPVMELPFVDRRRLLEGIMDQVQGPELILSEGLQGEGRSLFEKSRELGLEGVMAKRCASVYAAGKRNGAWVKFKHRVEAQLAIIGYIGKGDSDFQSLLVAGSSLPGALGREAEEGRLRFVGRVGSGFNDGLRSRLNELLRAHPRSAPLVPCPEKGAWVEPGLYCRVSYLEITSQGLLRAPAFETLIEA